MGKENDCGYKDKRFKIIGVFGNSNLCEQLSCPDCYGNYNYSGEGADFGICASGLEGYVDKSTTTTPKS
ncbi:MAG: hypothetical protein WC438_03580 [Candidatus Pacearchaeota archaeon]